MIDLENNQKDKFKMKDISSNNILLTNGGKSETEEITSNINNSLSQINKISKRMNTIKSVFYKIFIFIIILLFIFVIYKLYRFIKNKTMNVKNINKEIDTILEQFQK